MAAKWPCLVPKCVCRHKATVMLESGMDAAGSPETVKTLEVMANLSESGKQILTADRRLVRLSASLTVPGDIAPGTELEGWVNVDGWETPRRIAGYLRGRNPDGTVNFVRLDLE